MAQPIHVSEVARLARIALNECEKAQLQKDLMRVFHWVDQLESLCLQAIDTVASSPSEMREDEVELGIPSDEVILKNAPSVQASYFIVPTVGGMEKFSSTAIEAVP
jgi:aspartyl/glutamyl-tRNA(Asn/Gln) amidotransferase C subunit